MLCAQTSLVDPCESCEYQEQEPYLEPTNSIQPDTHLPIHSLLGTYTT